MSEVLDLGLELMDFVGMVGFELEQDFLSWKGRGLGLQGGLSFDRVVYVLAEEESSVDDVAEA